MEWYRCQYKRNHGCKKDYVWNPSTCTCDNGMCLESIADDLVNVSDKIIIVTNTDDGKR